MPESMLDYKTFDEYVKIVMELKEKLPPTVYDLMKRNMPKLSKKGNGSHPEG